MGSRSRISGDASTACPSATWREGAPMRKNGPEHFDSRQLTGGGFAVGGSCVHTFHVLEGVRSPSEADLPRDGVVMEEVDPCRPEVAEDPREETHTALWSPVREGSGLCQCHSCAER